MKKEIKEEIRTFKDKLLMQQLKLREAKIPVIVLIEGWAAAGKGSLINELISELDPRFYNVTSRSKIRENDDRYPFLYPYAGMIPPEGKIMFFDSGWMSAAVRPFVCREITEQEYKNRVRSVNEFERQLRDGGYLVLKIFLDISKEEQFERLSDLSENADTEWRVKEDDLLQLREHRLFREAFESFMEETGKVIPWHVLDAKKRKEKIRDAFRLLTDAIDKAAEAGKYNGEPFEEEFPLIKMPKLSDVDLSRSIPDEEYKEKLKTLQDRLAKLHNLIFRRKIPVILCYEGWDAAGKGGNIRRVSYPLDPRAFECIPIAAPEPHELARHYLWRFWKEIPRTGHVCIFDRTWYGRVMVERLEGFCTENDWKRAYNEINEFERQLTDWGAVVLKFWIHIDQETQLERFTSRQNTPEKQWKITEEDWRNRDKWPQYETVVNEMLQKTSTENAPWFIIESNDKKYARIRTLTIIVDALEKACADYMKKHIQ